MAVSHTNHALHVCKQALIPNLDPKKVGYKPVDQLVTRQFTEFAARQLKRGGFVGVALASVSSLPCSAVALYDAAHHGVRGVLKIPISFTAKDGRQFSEEMIRAVWHLLRALHCTAFAIAAPVGLLVPGALQVIDDALGVTAVWEKYQPQGCVQTALAIADKGKKYAKRTWRMIKAHPKVAAGISAGALLYGVCAEWKYLRVALRPLVVKLGCVSLIIGTIYYLRNRAKKKELYEPSYMAPGVFNYAAPSAPPPD